MKELDYYIFNKNNNPDIKEMMWMVFSLVRETLNPNEYFYIFYLFILRKEGIKIYDSHGIKNLNTIVFRKGDYKKNKQEYFHSLNVEFLSIQQKIENEFGHGIYDIISKFDFNEENFDFGEAFDYILYKFSDQKMGLQENFLPKEIAKLAIGLAGDLMDKNVYNPFAGLNSFATFSKDTKSFLAQEINHNSFVIGQLRLIAHNKLNFYTLLESDSIDKWQHGAFDLIISNPPFGLKIFGEGFHGQRSGPRNCESFIINKSFDSLSEKGKMILVISQNFLYSTGLEKRIREKLINQGWIQRLILLPAGLLSNTSMPICILVIDKDNKLNGNVHFVNAESFVEKIEKNKVVLKDVELLKFIHHSDSNKHSVIVSAQKIKDNDFNLSPNRYLRQDEIQLEGTTLGMFLKPIINREREFNERVKYVKIENLKNDNLNFRLDINSISEISIDLTVANKIEENAILIASKGKMLKPTYFEYKGTPIYTSLDIISFSIKSDVCDLEYLVYELTQESLNKQIDIFRTGTVLPAIKAKDLLLVKLKLPTIDTQKAIVHGLKEANIRLSLLEAERKAQAYGLENLLYKNNASLKHALGTPLISVSSAFQNIINALDNQVEDWKEINVSKIHNINIGNCINSIFTNLDLIHTILNKIKGIDMSQYKLSPISIIDFLIKYKTELDSISKPNVNIELVVSNDFYFENNRGVLVNANNELLKIAFNFIIDNANRHGFIDEARKYRLQINIGLYKDEQNNYLVKLEVSNNGRSFDKGFGLEELTRINTFSGTSGNSGIGGHDLNEIIKYLNNGKSTLDLKLAEDDSDEFATTYIFLIPILKFEENEAI